jgi:hypothetical protein
VRLLDRRQPAVNLSKLRVLLGLRQSPIKGRAVDLALKIGGVALSRIFFRRLGTRLSDYLTMVASPFLKGWDYVA